jgi:hypothetical protein
MVQGLYRCGLPEHDLTGVQTYYALTPRDTVGSSFPDAANAAQISFGRGVELAQVSYDRVVD